MLDTKSKRNRRLRILLTVLFLAALVAGNLFAFPKLVKQANELEDESVSAWYVDAGELDRFYHGCYVLYAKQRPNLSGDTTYGWITGETAEDKAKLDINHFFNFDSVVVEGTAEYEARNLMSEWLKEWDAFLWEAKDGFDYFAVDAEGTTQTNAMYTLGYVANARGREEAEQAIKTNGYEYCFSFAFDGQGNLKIDVLSGDELGGHTVTQEFENYAREHDVLSMLKENIDESTLRDDLSEMNYLPIRNYTVYYGIPRDSEISFLSYVEEMANYQIVSVLPYLMSAAALILWMVLMTSRTIWKDIKNFDRKGRWYVAEVGVIGVIFSVSMFACYFGGLEFFDDCQLGQIPGLWPFHYKDLEILAQGAVLFAMLYAAFAVIYLTLLCFRPLFTLGLVGYIRQYSLIYVFFSWLRRSWRGLLRGAKEKCRRFSEEVRHLDFTEKSTKTIGKIVLVNFAVLALLMCIWLFGLIGLVAYSLALFMLMKRYYERLSCDYQKLLAAMNKMAEGDLSEPVQEDMGIFDPLQKELTRIRGGFRKAVDEEVKSQKMKTELITNVSHDLKTPLTAITTYVELLKKKDITEEERLSYIETLERKAFRLKVLIEDLFEVSKAQSADVSLDLMDVDLINLMRQVAVEHQDKMERQRLEIRWSVPEEKVVLPLDNQKTYRIFENLFVNIEKYAMPGSRVYVQVTKKNGEIRVVLKNMSASELNVAPEELTERFVRGDASRNTEGSGLGLAIARSFTELQKGTFSVDVDGDLFKAVLTWKEKE